jgi:Protein of unknown function (DUF3365)
MLRSLRWNCSVMACVVGMTGAIYIWGAEPPGTTAAGVCDPVGREPRVAVARDRAKLMHDVYAATLEAVHEHYFHGERAIVPARALEDVFAEIAIRSKIEARWISVNTKAMSIKHEPKSDFEKKAATELAAGKNEIELVEKGRYLRAAPIPLASECVSCHTGFFAAPPKSPRFAGLVISIPIDAE